MGLCGLPRSISSRRRSDWKIWYNMRWRIVPSKGELEKERGVVMSAVLAEIDRMTVSDKMLVIEHILRSVRMLP